MRCVVACWCSLRVEMRSESNHATLCRPAVRVPTHPSCRTCKRTVHAAPENAPVTPDPKTPVIARSAATRRSMGVRFHHTLDCRAPLAMTLRFARNDAAPGSAPVMPDPQTPVIARSAATRRSMAVRFHPVLDCRAALAMTRRFTRNDEERQRQGRTLRSPITAPWPGVPRVPSAAFFLGPGWR